MWKFLLTVANCIPTRIAGSAVIILVASVGHAHALAYDDIEQEDSEEEFEEDSEEESEEDSEEKSEEDSEEESEEDSEEESEEESEEDSEEESEEEFKEGSFLFWTPSVEGEFYVDLSNDWTFASDDPDTEVNELSFSMDLDVNVFLAEPAFLTLTVSRDTIAEPDPGRNRYFGGETLSVDNLSLNWEAERWSLIGGKFIPNFSIAYYAAPGLYGTDIVESDIELYDRIGLGGSLTFLSNERFGTHVLSASVFFADTSALSDLLGKDDDRLRRRDGGPGNTGSLKSFAVALDGGQIEALPGFRYHLGFVRQAVDRVADTDFDEDEEEDTDTDLEDDVDEPPLPPDVGNGDDNGDADGGDNGDADGGDNGDVNGGDDGDAEGDDSGDGEDNEEDGDEPSLPPDGGNGDDNGDVNGGDDGDAEGDDSGDGEDNEEDGDFEDEEQEDNENVDEDEDEEDAEPLAVVAPASGNASANASTTFLNINSIMNAANGIDDDGNGDEYLPSDEIGDEYRFVVAGEWTMQINDDLTLTPLVEYVHFWNADGILDEGRDYLTIASLLEYRNWSLAASYTGRFVKEPDGTRTNATLFQVSAGYTWNFGLGVGIGYRLFNEDDIMSHTVGVLLSYEYSFGL